MGVVLNATNHGSTLSKKSMALAYHFVRAHVACGVENNGGSDQGVLPGIRLTTSYGTLLIPDPSGYLQAGYIQKFLPAGEQTKSRGGRLQGSKINPG
eukprot:10656201-Ditylum_brightwellii.AAC.1